MMMIRHKGDRFQQWLKDRKSDLWLGETVNVLDDMITQRTWSIINDQNRPKQPEAVSKTWAP